MAHKKFKDICYIDCTDSSHDINSIGMWINGTSYNDDNVIIRDYRRFSEARNSWEAAGKFYEVQLTQGDYNKYGDKVFGKDEYFADKAESKISSSFSNVPGAKIPYPKDKYAEVKPTTIVPDDLLMASQFNHLINKFNSDLNLEKIKYDSSLNLAKTKEAILKNELLKKQNEQLSTANNISLKNNELLSEANKIQEKISKKETTFKNTATVTNHFDKDFAENLGKSIGDSLKPTLDSLNETLKSIEKSFAEQTKYYENQKATNEKIVKKADLQIESLEFEKNGTGTLKNSDGETIKPREAKALKDAEVGIAEKNSNSIDFIDLALSTYESVLGIDNDDVNPMKMLYGMFLEYDKKTMEEIDKANESEYLSSNEMTEKIKDYVE